MTDKHKKKNNTEHTSRSFELKKSYMEIKIEKNHSGTISWKSQSKSNAMGKT